MSRFHSLTDGRVAISFSHFEAKPDAAHPGSYAGVLIIQKGVAKGHYAVKDGARLVNFDAANPDHAELRKYQIVIGDDTLDDVVRCGAEAESTKCKLDHGATIKDIVGDYATFRRDGDQVRADLTLMASTQHRAFVEELFAKFSKKVGNSIDFDYRYEIQGEVAVARCVKLNSVDIVDAPAATNSLFTENPNPTPPSNMALSKEDLDAITGTVNTAVDARFSKLEKDINTRFDEVKTKMEDGDDADEKKKKDDEEKKKKDDADGGEKMSAGAINKAVLSAVREIFPKATVDNLNSLAAGTNTPKDEYAEKYAAALALGMSAVQATKFMANKHPGLYNAKFGNGGGGKGSAKTTL